MPKGTRLSDYEKGQIRALSDSGSSVSEISRQIGRSRTVITNFLADSLNYGTQKSTGRPPALTPRAKRRILSVASNSTIGVRQIKKNLELDASKDTIHRVLKASPNIQRCRMATRPKITDADKVNRLAFARQHMTWTDKWKKVIF